MTEPTNAELANFLNDLAAQGYILETGANKLRLAASRLESLPSTRDQGEISDSQLDTAVTAAKEWLDPPHDELNIRHAIGAALEAARKG